MNKIDRVVNTIRGSQVDHIPMGFWLHFPKEVILGGVDAQVNAHIEFKNKTKTDILKIMNENEMRSNDKIENIWDWKKIRKLNKNSDLIVNQREILKRVVEENDGDCFLLGTVHGLMASLSHSSGHSYTSSPQLIKDHYKREPQMVLDAVSIIEENTQMMLEETLNSGVNGIYYAALGGEKDKLTDEEFEAILKPGEIRLLSQAKNKKDNAVFLHMCKEKVALKRYQDYPCDVVNWAMHESNYSFDECKTIFGDKVFLGGFDDRSGVLVDGDASSVRKELLRIEEMFGDNRYIVGADCTLPTEIDFARIRMVHDILETDKTL
ncbi:MAG: uroporphyrinogen decarboxylase family protein [Carnobacterium sp.]